MTFNFLMFLFIFFQASMSITEALQYSEMPFLLLTFTYFPNKRSLIPRISESTEPADVLLN